DPAGRAAHIEQLVRVRNANGVVPEGPNLVEHRVEGSRPQAMQREVLRLETKPVDAGQAHGAPVLVQDVAAIGVEVAFTAGRRTSTAATQRTRGAAAAGFGASARWIGTPHGACRTRSVARGHVREEQEPNAENTSSHVVHSPFEVGAYFDTHRRARKDSSATVGPRRRKASISLEMVAAFGEALREQEQILIVVGGWITIETAATFGFDLLFERGQPAGIAARAQRRQQNGEETDRAGRSVGGRFRSIDTLGDPSM